MITKSSFRGPKGLAEHILQGSANELIVERHDLSVGGSQDVGLDIANFAAIGHAHGTKKSLVHISLSPDLALTNQQESDMLGTLRRIYGLSPDHPLSVVQHRKPGQTIRPDHYHVVVQRVRTDNLLVSSRASYARNERLSRELEVDFGHAIRVGRFSRAVHEALALERPEIADLVDPTVRADRQSAATLTVADMQHARDTSLDIAKFDQLVLDTYLACRGNPSKMIDGLKS